MKAIGYNHETENINDLQLLDLPIRHPEKDEVLIRVKRVGLNPADYRQLMALKSLPHTIPHIPGYDFSGEITETGSQIHNFKIGDAVYGRVPVGNSNGACAEYVTIKADNIAKKPEKISFSQAATIPIPFETAYYFMIQNGHPHAGQTVLVLGGGGSVGSMAVMLAKNAGAKVIATGLTKDIPAINKAGADIAIDASKDGLTNLTEKADMVLNTVGEKALLEALPHIKDNGKVIAMTLMKAPAGSQQINPTLKWKFFVVSPGNTQVLEKANDLIEQGVYQPAYETTLNFTVDDIKKGSDLIMGNHKTGRIVVKIA